MSPLTSQQTGPTRRTGRIGAESLAKEHPLFGQLLNMRSRYRMTVGLYITTRVVGVDINDMRFFHRKCSHRITCADSKRYRVGQKNGQNNALAQTHSSRTRKNKGRSDPSSNSPIHGPGENVDTRSSLYSAISRSDLSLLYARPGRTRQIPLLSYTRLAASPALIPICSANPKISLK